MNKNLIILGVVLLIGIGVGIFYFMKNKPVSETTTTSGTKEQSGLSSLLGNLNLSGFSIFKAGA